ncbi:MAG: prephenate dehydrogenase/arogenate dehydrogenase family protein [Lachnospiraceae bacterium]|nr:prephenate dehydrogenase/arogenate dehydrogenase family protein [Lachnospiraceae bacterium]
MKIGIIGLGLIGGSLAKSIKQAYPDTFIVAANRSADSVEKALAEGTVDLGLQDITDGFAGCDIIFLCAPVKTNISFLEKLKAYLEPETILTDVGSVKSGIHEAVERILPETVFIGGHPMAGKEKVRYDNASAQLLKDAYYYLTPSKTAKEHHVLKLEVLVRGIGANPVIVEPSLHDFIVAAISHVPHMAAYSLVKLVKDEDTPEEYMRISAAGGFKDITRVASSDPTMWQQICLENRENITDLMRKYIKELENVTALIEKGDSEALFEIFDTSKKYRDSIIG